jgi:hypothetical protein
MRRVSVVRLQDVEMAGRRDATRKVTVVSSEVIGFDNTKQLTLTLFGNNRSN